jgi:hypothetical protein
MRRDITISTILNSKQAAAIIGAVLIIVVYLGTLQLSINGSQHPYTTDVGEIQNALPRWGTIHFPGYPLYTFTGSVFVSAVRLLGLKPAVGSSLLSAIWGAISIALLIVLDFEFEVPAPAAILTAILFGLSTSFWVDSSIAEVHTLSVVLMFLSVIFAIRFGRNGRRSQLLWLSLFYSQAVLHQRALVFMAIGLLILVLPQRKALYKGLLPAIGVGALSSLIYLYLPLRAWQGAKWTFNQPGTWRGFWSLVFDTKSERIINIPTTLGDAIVRGQTTIEILSNEWPLILLAVGLLGTIIIGIRSRPLEAIGISLIWLPFLLISLVIWEGGLSDALLAVNLPVIAMSALGLAILSAQLLDQSRILGSIALLGWLLLAGLLFVNGRPEILKITRSPIPIDIAAISKQIEDYDDKRPTTLMTLWGQDYWTLAYAQAYEESLTGINLVDHNADLGKILDSNERLITLDRTFYQRPLSWWDDRYGPVYLSSINPGIIEIDNEPLVNEILIDGGPDRPLGNGITVRAIETNWEAPDLLKLIVYWQAERGELEDYSVAVHLVEEVALQSQENILAQSDATHPVSGWYPTSRWTRGEIVKDSYLLELPEEAEPVAVRLAMYQIGEGGEFENTEWITVSLP